MTQYEIGDMVRVRATFTDIEGSAADPTTVQFQILSPSGTITNYVYGTDMQLVRESVGIYYVNFQVVYSGIHNYRFVGTGTVAATGQGYFLVQPLNI